MRGLSEVTPRTELAFQSGAGILPGVFFWLCVDTAGLPWAESWGRLPCQPHSPPSATPSVPVLPAVSRRLPDFIVGDLSLVLTTDLSEGLLTTSETLRETRDLFVILAGSQFSSEPRSPEPGGGTPCRRGAERDREGQGCWRRVPARMSLDLGVCVAQPVAEGERDMPGHVWWGRLAGAHVCAWGPHRSWAPWLDSVQGGKWPRKSPRRGQQAAGCARRGHGSPWGPLAPHSLLNAGHRASVLIRY